MKRLSLLTAILTFGIFLVSACKKVEGEGGTSTITGKIMVNKKNSSGSTIATYEAQNYDVYIIYGEGTVHDDKTETSYDGNFEFKFLEKGNYTIYTYEKCTSCASGDQVVLKTIEVTKAKETVDIGTIEVVD